MSQAVAVPEEVRYKLCDMGYYNDAMKGYLIAGMRRMGFSEIEIRKAVLGMRVAHDELTAAAKTKRASRYSQKNTRNISTQFSRYAVCTTARENLR